MVHHAHITTALRTAKDQPEDGNPVDAAHGTTGDPVVELRGIRKSFGATEVLHGVDLTVHAGEHVVVFGPSGSG
ncbi:MAG TPA: hypothetical protein VLS46_03895, partial [Gaiellaceae bacterium]|nr:hypothetical protein [Gaiellaceae bacterium]